MAKTKLRKPARKRPARSASSADAPPQAESTPLNRSLSAAKKAKQDEFYTQYVDIQKEIEAYLEFDLDTFKGKIVYCNCDDPFESNFFKYFAANFNKLGLKKLITTSYDGSPIAGQGTLFPEYNEGNGKRKNPKALAVIIDHVKDEDGDGAANVTDVALFLKRNNAARIALKGDEGNYPGGDFRSPECVAFLKQADIVVTNPPFSLFREYVAQLMEHKKKLLVIGNLNAIKYKVIFPHVQNDELWLGPTISSGDREFQVPESYPLDAAGWRVDENGTKFIRVKGVRWYTNLDHGRRHQPLSLMTMAENRKFNKKIQGKSAYERYENYDAIEVPTTDSIPSDYDKTMGVPISFLDKYNPNQFEIIWQASGNTRASTPEAVLKRMGYSPHSDDRGGCAILNGKRTYDRVFIRHRKPAKKGKE
ncbi:MAG: adenine-specific methyltransferase EcoRI family protein [Zoogloeaceae bacterium]|nr:adenine-specific methyltransferase EcoRI family protein [Zoogloeaceae bacterium]MCW5617463.1 adenine-specific methyltransferase EcoRI family protein [Rhodocyclaceae bacterium]